MCGITGIIRTTHSDISTKETLIKMRDYMYSRGPDGSGIWCSNDGMIGLGHRRLSIIDLSDRSSQPMVRSSAIISFNGENL